MAVIWNETVEDRSGRAAMIGTVLHDEFERVALGGDPSLTPNAVIELDVLDCGQARAQTLLDRAIVALRALEERYQIGERWHEVRVDPGAAIGRSDFWGTSDYIGISGDGSTLVVGDAKFGKIKIDPRLNEQLLAYASGALRFIDQGVAVGIETIAIAIIQPTAPGIGLVVWETDRQMVADFLEHCRERLALTDLDEPPVEPSATACQWCKGRYECPSRAI